MFLRCVWDVHLAHIYWASIMCQSESERESLTQIPSLSALTGEASLKSVDAGFYSFPYEWLVVGAGEDGEVSGMGEEPGRSPHRFHLGRRRRPKH